MLRKIQTYLQLNVMVISLSIFFSKADQAYSIQAGLAGLSHRLKPFKPPSFG